MAPLLLFIIAVVVIVMMIIVVVISGLGPRVLGLLKLQKLAISKAKLQLSSHGPLLVAA